MTKLIAALLLLTAQASADASNGTSARTAYAVTPVNTSTPVTLIASLPNQVLQVDAFDSSGKTMKLVITEAGTTTSVLIPPGGMLMPLKISKGAKVDLIAVSGTATAGESDINFYY